MSITHYFSRNPDRRSKFIFNLIAPLYGRLDYKLQEEFKVSSIELDKEIMITGKSVMDIGSGTGAWGASINRLGASKIHGIDFSEKMVKQAQKNHPNLFFSLAHAENLSDFQDNSFDIVTASFVLHGVKQEKRENILNEMKRISRRYVVLHDFIGKTPLFIRFLEFMERSDYKNFKKNICDELKEIFPKTIKIPSRFGSGLYIAKK